MIASFKHKGLELFYKEGSLKGINAMHARRLREILTTLDFLGSLGSVSLKRYGLHPLSADLQGFWSVEVSGAWRVIFRYKDKEKGVVELLNYLNYH